MNPQVISAGQLLVTLVALVLHIVYIATPHVGKTEIDVEHQHLEIDFGLWEMCSKVAAQEQCVKYTKIEEEGDMSLPTWLDAIRITGIIAVLVTAASCGLSLFSIIRPSRGDRLRIFPIISSAASTLAGVFIMVGVLIVAVKMRTLLEFAGKADSFVKKAEDNFTIAWGTILDILAFILMIFSAICFYILSRGTGGSTNLVL